MYEGLVLVLDVPRQRLITAEKLAVLEAVEAVVAKWLKDGSWELRPLSFDECAEAIVEIEAARTTLAPAFDDLVPYDSHAGHYEAMCDNQVYQIEQRRRKLPKQLSFLGTEETKPVQPVSSNVAPSRRRVALDLTPVAQQLSLFG